MTRPRQVRATSVISLKAGSGTEVAHHLYPARTPVLAIAFGSTSVLVTTSGASRIQASDVEFARWLAREATAFALACERMYRSPGSPAKRGRAA